MSRPDRGGRACVSGPPLRGRRETPRAPVTPRPAPDSSGRRTLLVLIATVAAVAAMLAGCSTGPTAPAASPSSDLTDAAAPTGNRLLDPAAFAAEVADPSPFTINVHVPFEGSIGGTDAEIPFNRLAVEAARLPADRGTPLAIYCRSGRMSAIAASELARLGYGNVVELRGGMQAWVEQGFSLITTAPGSGR